MSPKTCIMLLCASVFIASLIAMFFIALYFSEHREKENWRHKAEKRGELAEAQAKTIYELER